MGKAIFIACILVTVSCIAYIFSTYCIQDTKLQTAVSGISLEIISGGALGFAVLIAGFLLERNWEKNAEISKIDSEITSLTSRLKNNFRRGKPRWNFSNRGPSFYFDIGWVNPTYDLLSSDNGRFETIIYQYENSHQKTRPLIRHLKSFIELMELTLIEAEKLDQKLIESVISPKVAAVMSSGYLADRNSAQLEADLEYWITRASWAGVTPTEIIFGLARHTRSQLTIERVENLSNTAQDLIKRDKTIKTLVKNIQSGQRSMNKQITTIRKLL